MANASIYNASISNHPPINPSQSINRQSISNLSFSNSQTGGDSTNSNHPGELEVIHPRTWFQTDRSEVSASPLKNIGVGDPIQYQLYPVDSRPWLGLRFVLYHNGTIRPDGERTKGQSNPNSLDVSQWPCIFRAQCVDNCEPHHQLRVFLIPRDELETGNELLHGMFYQFLPWLCPHQSSRERLNSQYRACGRVHETTEHSIRHPKADLPMYRLQLPRR